MKNQKYIQQLDIPKIISLDKQGKSLKSIGEYLGIPYRRLSEMIRQFNIPVTRKNRYNVKSNGFNKLDEATAYILGYTIADGCVRVAKGGSGNYYYRLLYLVSEDDGPVLEYIKKHLCPDCIIRNIYNSKGAKHRKPQLSLRFANKYLITTLMDKYSVKPRKTFDNFFKLTNMPDHLWSHVIRGYFDGDGYLANGRNIGFTFNSIVFARQVINKLREHAKFCYSLKRIEGKTCTY